MRTIKVGRKHVFVDDPPARDPRTGQQWCLCGLPADNAVHELPVRSDDEREAEMRRVGESE
jgi:hypothetical protein